MRNTFIYVVAAVALYVVALPAQSEEALSGEELKELISDKTLHVTNPKKGDSWHISDKGEHCNDLAKNPKFKCAKVYDKGNGTYERVSDDGSMKVIWTKIVDGKDF